MGASLSEPVRVLMKVMDAFPMLRKLTGVSVCAHYTIIRRLQGCLYSRASESSFVTILDSEYSSEGHQLKTGHSRSKPKQTQESKDSKVIAPFAPKTTVCSFLTLQGAFKEPLVRPGLMTTGILGILVAKEPTEEGCVGITRNTQRPNNNGKVPR